MTSRADDRDGAAFYVYALLGAPVRVPRASGIAIEPIDRFFVAVARKSTPPAVTEEALRRQHRIVVRLNEAADGLLPVRFGTRVPRLELELLLRQRRRILSAALRRVRGRRQMTIRFQQASPPPPKRVVAAATGAAYLRARAASSRPLLTKEAEALRHALRSLVAAERLEPGRETLAMTMHHLIGRGAVGRYLGRIERVMKTLNDAPRVVVTGPFPAFAFVPDLVSGEGL